MKSIFFLISLFFTATTFSQTWKGKVTDATTGEELAFVNVYFEGTTIGTSTNLKGEFSLPQPESNRSYALLFQYVGYEKKRIDLNNLDPSRTVAVKLAEQSLKIPEVTIAAYKKDPAYYIIKQAQKKRKHYLNQVDSYSCKIYMKGTTRLVETPDKLPGLLKISVNDNEMDSIEKGIIGLSESINMVHYQKGVGFKEEMIASKVSGQSQAFSWNRASFVLTSFYEERIRMIGLNERGFISPIASDALFFYDYKLTGTFEEDGLLINRIAVMPKRKADPVFSGTIYITEDLWNIHSLNLKADKASQIEFVDSINIFQNFTKMGTDLFMPLSLQMTYHFGFLGFRANYDAIGNITDYELDKDYDKKFFKNEIFLVRDSANIQDSAYWNRIRPVILSEEENRNYYEGDSLKYVRSSREHLDSLDKADNKIRPFRLLTRGYTKYNSYDSVTYIMNSVVSGLQYTAVDGPALELRPRRIKENASGMTTIELGLRYGFLSERPGLKISYTELFNRKTYPRLHVEAGHFTQQINPSNPIPPLLNSIYTLVEGRNHAQFYQKTYIRAVYGHDVVNGLRLSGRMEMAARQNLENVTDYNLHARHFEENQPAHLDLTPSSESYLLKAGFEAYIVFGQKYATYPDRRVKYDSRLPKLNFSYHLGTNLEKNTGAWHFAELEVLDGINLGMLGSGEYSLKGGNFFGVKPRNLVDYKHFNGNRTLFLQTGSYPFQTLPYYTFSTNEAYAEAHYEHHFYGFLLNKVPLLKKLKFKEVAGINYLYTQSGKSYTEVYAGIENIFRIIRLDVVSYYQKGMPLRPVVRIGLRL